ncbi:MAG: helicase-related protein, partial [Anaerolineae bacterium]
VDALRALASDAALQVAYELPLQPGTVYLNRTHPFVEGLASYVIDSTLDPLLDGIGRRCGAIRTRAVSTTTALLLLRLRYHIVGRRADAETALLAEDCLLVGFEGSPDHPRWLQPEEVEALLGARPDANMAGPQATVFVQRVVERYEELRQPVRGIAEQRGEAILDAHQRVRRAARMGGVRYSIETHEPDVLGIYVLAPAGA